MVVRSSIAACVFNALMGLSHDVWQLLGVRALSGVFGGFSVAAIALVGTQVPEEYLGFSLGWMATGQLAGTLVGPLVGGLLADRIHDYRAVFFWTSAGTLAGALFCAALVREHAVHELRLARKRTTLWEQFRETARHPSILPLFTVIVLAQITARGMQPVIPLFVQSLLGSSPWLATAAGASLAITGIADFIASPWLGKRSDRIGYRRVMMISLAGTACFTLPQAIAMNIWAFLALRFGVGVFLGGVIPSANAWIGRLFPREQRGGVYGITASATFLGMFLGPLLSSTVAAHLGFAAMFLVIGLFTQANLIYVALATRRLTESDVT
jgi:DHA1 family multidrug resistance protein-like MFS transporter